MGLGQLFEIKPRCCEGSLLCDELGSHRFGAQFYLARSFPGLPAGSSGRLGFPNLHQDGNFFRKNMWPSATEERMTMRIINKPVALAWRQRASAALRARAAATSPPAIVNNPQGHFEPTRAQSTRRKAGTGKRTGFPLGDLGVLCAKRFCLHRVLWSTINSGEG